MESSSSCSTSNVGGWYSGRRGQYRSVAFGTWKVGGASKNLDIPPRTNHEHSGTASPVLRPKRLHHLGIDRNSRRMGESSPNLARIHPTETLRSLGALPSSLSTAECLGGGGGDCYSSTEYVEYSEGKSNKDETDCGNGNASAVSEPIQAAFRADRNLNYSVSTKRRSRLETSLQRVHHRSHSAGADAQFSVIGSPSSDMKNPLSIGREAANSNAKFLRATKKFFRKIYNTATLPNKKHQSNHDVITKSEAPVFDQRLRAPVVLSDEEDVDDDDDEDHTSRIEDYRIRPSGGYSRSAFLDTSYPDSGLDMDRSSTPDQSLESMTLTSKSDSGSSSSSSSRPEQWNDLFEQLRREMQQMRERDAQILADLHRVENSIRKVKRAQREDQRALDGGLGPVPSQQL